MKKYQKDFAELNNMLLKKVVYDWFGHGEFELATTGTLTIDGGSFICDAPLTASNWINLYGTFNLSDGLFEITDNGPQFWSGCNSDITGGIIRFAVAFAAIYAKLSV